MPQLWQPGRRSRRVRWNRDRTGAYGGERAPAPRDRRAAAVQQGGPRPTTPSSCRATRTRSIRCPACSRRSPRRDRAQPLSGRLGRRPARAARRAVRRRRRRGAHRRRLACRSSPSSSRPRPARATRSSTRGARSRRTPGSSRSPARRACRCRSPADARHDLPAMAAAITDRTRVDHRLQPEQPDRPDRHRRPSSTRSWRGVPADVLVMLDEAYAEFVTDPDAVDGRTAARPRTRTSSCCAPSPRRTGSPGCASATRSGTACILDAARATAHPALGHRATPQRRRAREPRRRGGAARAGRRDRRAPRPAVRAALASRAGASPSAQGNFVWLPTGDETHRPSPRPVRRRRAHRAAVRRATASGSRSARRSLWRKSYGSRRALWGPSPEGHPA